MSIARFWPALLEIQVELNGKATWFVPIEIVQGQIA